MTVSEITFWKESVGQRQQGATLVEFLVQACRLNESDARDLIDFGSVQVSGRRERNPSRRLFPGDEVRVHWPRKGIRRFYEVDPARFLHRDRSILAYDKEAGVPSQETPSDAYNNLYAAVLRHLKAAGGTPYAALHHRLDRETSGVMLFALDPSVNRALGSLFQQRRMVKSYLAWCQGVPEADRWSVEKDIGRGKGRYLACPKGEGKPARTDFRVLWRSSERSLVAAEPLTGRTHQVRLHLADSGHPVIGDRRYGSTLPGPLLLHAHRLAFPHPITGEETVVTAPLPEHFPRPPEGAIPG